MAKRRLSINQFEAFHLLFALKNAKLKKKALQELLLPIQTDIAAAIAEVNDKTAIRDAVISAILAISGFPPPVVDAQPLSGMGFTPSMYNKLAAAMTVIVQHYNPTATILASDVRAAATVGGCVELAIDKAGV